MVGESLTALTQVGITPLTFGFFPLYHPKHTIRSLCPSVAYRSFWGCWTQGEPLRFQQYLSKYAWWLKTYVESKTLIILCLSPNQTIQRNFHITQVTSRSTWVKMSYKQPVMAKFPAYFVKWTQCIDKNCTVAAVLKYWDIFLKNERVIWHLFKSQPSFRLTLRFSFSIIQPGDSFRALRLHTYSTASKQQSSLPALKPSKSKTKSWTKCQSETAASDNWLMTINVSKCVLQLETKCWASNFLLLVLRLL